MKSIKHFLSLILLVYSQLALSQIPILNSNPGITNKVIYLDFDGQKVSGTAWNGGNTINAAASVAMTNTTNLRTIWNRISEDYRPFSVNVTTDSMRFNNAHPTSRIRVVFTPTSAWYGSAGGVAYLGSFTWGGYPGTPCWVFENQLNYNTKSMAEAASHEAGHTLSLIHQSTYNSSCVKTAEYNTGQGTGVTGWAPIMGVGYNRNVTTWYNGKSAAGCNINQLDHGNGSPGITNIPYLSFLPDDVGDNFVGAKILNLNTVLMADSGIITTPADLDAYRFEICNTRYVSVNVRPWALDSTPGSYSGANLDVKLKLFNASGTMLAADSSLTKLNALLGLNLSPGQYYFTIDGAGANNYSDYGSLGKYYLSVKATNPPQLTNNIVLPSSICSGQNVTLNYTSNGSPTNWQWTITGPQNASFATAAPSFAFNSTGLYTISLLATIGSSASCVVTRTVNAGVQPTLTVIGTNTVLCPSLSASLVVSGASSYTWMPGNFNGNSLITSPSVTTIYTVAGINGSCYNSVVTTLTVSPQFSVSVSASSSTICSGNSTTLTASGASSYVFNPGGITSNPAVVTPAGTTIFTITGTFTGCNKTVGRTIVVRPTNYLIANANNTLVCPGEPVTINLSGGSGYTLQPGNVTGNPMVVGTLVPKIFTITSTDNFQCSSTATVEIQLADCDLTGVKETAETGKLTIFPNPANSSLFIQSANELEEVQVFNITGALIFKANGVNAKMLEIEVQSWNTGVYMVVSRSKDSEKQLATKLVIE